MNRDKILRALLSVLIVVSVFIWARAISRLSGVGYVPPEAEKIIPRQDTAAGMVSAPGKERKKSSYRGWGRNPFDVNSARVGLPVLNGVLWGDRNPQAVIDGEIVGIGSAIGPYTIHDIKQDRVYLTGAQGDLELKWEEE